MLASMPVDDRPRLLLDCDPGHDDAVAIIAAAAFGEIVGIVTVAGNVPLDRTTHNALVMRDLIGLAVPVHSGSSRPLVAAPRHAGFIHGESGLDGAELPQPTTPLDGTHGVEFIIETCRSSEGLWLVPTGPLTNIGTAFRLAPDLPDRVAGVSLMGGGSFGNRSSAAEFNIWADPEAARIVFDADWQVTMIGLDLTLQAQANSIVIARLKQLGALADTLIVPLATFYFNPNVPDWDGQAVHDVCAVAYVARPDLFDTRPARVDVETRGEFTSGMTVVDFDSPAPNALVATGLDVSGFWAYVETVYARVAAEHTA